MVIRKPIKLRNNIYKSIKKHSMQSKKENTIWGVKIDSLVKNKDLHFNCFTSSSRVAVLQRDLIQQKESVKNCFVRYFNFLWTKWGSFYLLIADISATQNIDGAKELVVLL